VVERGPYDLLFGQRKARAEPGWAARPQGGQKAVDLYARLLGAEPHATADPREADTSWIPQCREHAEHPDLPGPCLDPGSSQCPYRTAALCAIRFK
jgi:hypothetical protein